MKILLLGKNGQLGFELTRSLQPLGQVLALNRHTDDNGFCGDITNFSTITYVINEYQPDIIVNATAYTAVDKAESDNSTADLINHLAVSHLADCAKQQNSLLIHYSSDYVFDGSGDTAWIETAKTNPINYYGISKRNGELALENSGVRFINIRTSWIFGVYGNNFLKTMLRLGKEKETLNIINDQIGAPTPAFLIADITAQLIQYYKQQSYFEQDNLTGHYHLAPMGHCSWYEYASFIFETAHKLGIELKVNAINPIATSEYPTPAKRPFNSRLDSNKIIKNFNLSLPHWHFGVEQVLKTLIQQV